MSSVHTALLYIQQNWFELTALVISILGVWLTALEKTINWPVNILACVLYGILFYLSGIYLDASLQIFFIVFSIYGWYLWTRKDSNKHETLLISNISLKTFLILITIGMPVTVLSAYILGHFFNSTIPYFDATTTVLSLIATWMAAKKHIESWLVWILTDLIYIPEYLIKHLYPTALLYFIFTLLAVYGYFEWRKLRKKSSV
jgi:nicotinamide mononucleotide transporter